ncbi:MAG: ATP-binding protein [Chloroflexi bacterium]|nr:ATP-binding protein [Chloroflexota bacterium]
MITEDQAQVHQDTTTSSTGQPAGRNDNHRLATMFKIARILAAEHDLDRMVPQLLSCLIDTLAAADAGVLMLYASVEGILTVRAAQGYDLDAFRQIRLAPGESMTGKAFLTGQAELYATPETTAAAMDNMTPPNRAIFARAASGVTKPLSAVVLPLITNQTRVGVLLLENLHQPCSFTPDDLTFLKPIADLLALSIENTRLREELEAVRSLSEANRLKAEVISTLAHELRTPLTSIKGYSTALLMEEASFGPETQREFLQIIDEECDVLQDLIHDLLESSIIDAGFLKLEVQPVLLSRLAMAATEEFSHVSQRHRFVVDFPPRVPVVDADPRRVTQVLRNLLDNAVKYSPDGGLIVVRGEVREREVVVSVADQGEGIAPEHLNRLFEKFFRIKSGLGRHVVGTGLGLPIARTIVESHGGRIWAESQLGRGTTLSFTIPFTPASQEPSQEAKDE